jgi:DNA-3-methyladenine glycosylase
VYVYFTYGMHWCANLVCQQTGTGTAVLLRAGEVVDGLEPARERRPTARRDADLCRGPARLATTLGLTGADDGIDACSGPFRVLRGAPPGEIRSGPRVGVSVGAEEPWRWWIADHPTVSTYKPGRPRGGRSRNPQAAKTVG